MGKHLRASRAEQIKKERIKKRAVLGGTFASLGLAGLIAYGAIQGSEAREAADAQGSDTVELGENSPARAALNDYTEYFGCSIDPASIQISVVSDIAPNDGGEQGALALARTLKTGEIEIASYVAPEKYRSLVLHEATHACANVGEPKMLTEPIYIEALGESIVGFRGFRAMFASGPENSDAEFVLLEEALAELLSTEFEGHSLSSTLSYVGPMQTLDAIAEYRNISTQTFSSLQQDSDFFGFVSLAKNKPIDEVNANDIADIMYLFAGSAIEGKAPSNEDVAFILNYTTSQVR